MLYGEGKNDLASTFLQVTYCSFRWLDICLRQHTKSFSCSTEIHFMSGKKPAGCSIYDSVNWFKNLALGLGFLSKSLVAKRCFFLFSVGRAKFAGFLEMGKQWKVKDIHYSTGLLSQKFNFRPCFPFLWTFVHMHSLLLSCDPFINVLIKVPTTFKRLHLFNYFIESLLLESIFTFSFDI